MTQLTELDYDSIENAVMATARGRWFLAEHKKRHGGSDTPAILEAIAKLEKVITSINLDDHAKNPVESATFVAPATTAPATPVFAPAVVNIPEKTESAAPSVEPATEETLQFFSNDEDLFADDGDTFLSSQPPIEETTSAPVVETVEVETPETTPEAVNERFKIFKTAPDDTQVEDDPSIEAKTQEPDQAGVPDIKMEATGDEQERIIVIRDTAGEEIDIPLVDEFDDTTENATTATN